MSQQSYWLGEIRPLLRPVADYVAWPVAFIVATTISQQLAYFLALFLVATTDAIDTSGKTTGLFRDFTAGATTALLALTLNNNLGIALGATVAVVAAARLIQKL